MLTHLVRGLLPDCDDTAKTIVALRLLGRSPTPDEMIRKYEAADHFQTYVHERNSSFSANCNVLKALLSVKNVDDVQGQVAKATKFVCNTWWSTEGHIKDKWVHRLHIQSFRFTSNIVL